MHIESSLILNHASPGGPVPGTRDPGPGTRVPGLRTRVPGRKPQIDWAQATACSIALDGRFGMPMWSAGWEGIYHVLTPSPFMFRGLQGAPDFGLK